MQKYWEFEVQGSGSFPTDMLRYDACYPANPAAVAGLNDIQTPQFTRGIRTVCLISQVRAPTEGRWESFGWRVMRVEVRSR